MKPVSEQTNVPAFGAWRAVDEVRHTLKYYVRQRRNEFLLAKLASNRFSGR